MQLNNFLYVLGVIGMYRMLIYAIGDVYNEYNPKAILAGFSAYLAEKRLEQLGIFDYPTIISASSAEMHILNKEAVNSYLVDRVKPVAGWLNALSFCPTCTSFYIMALFVLLPLGFGWFGISLLLTRIVFKWI